MWRSPSSAESQGKTPSWRAAIYGDDHELLDERFGTGDGHVLFTTPENDIRFFRLFASRTAQVGLDTLEYNAPVVPEPGTMLLIGSGMAVLLRRRFAQTSSNQP